VCVLGQGRHHLQCVQRLRSRQPLIMCGDLDQYYVCGDLDQYNVLVRCELLCIPHTNCALRHNSDHYCKCH
jgi:hypothetical protein